MRTKTIIGTISIIVLMAVNFFNYQIDNNSDISLLSIQKSFANSENPTPGCFKQVYYHEWMYGCHYWSWVCWDGDSPSCTKGYAIDCPGEEYLLRVSQLNC